MKKIVLCFMLLAMTTACSGKDFIKDITKKAEAQGFDVVEENGNTYLAKDYDKDNFSRTDSRMGLFEDGFEIRNSLNIIYTLGNNGDFSNNLPFSKSCNLKDKTCDSSALEDYANVKNEILSEFDLDIEDYDFGE